MSFRGWGLGTNPLRHLALLDASSPEGGAFCALSPSGRGTILNGLRCALAMFSGKIILNFRVWHTRVCAAMKAPVGLLSGRAVCVSRWRGFAPTSSAERDRRFFHRRGHEGKMAALPLPSCRFAAIHLPQGDGFSSKGKVCGSAKGVPLGELARRKP